jgi:enoyl-CoA hydratase
VKYEAIDLSFPATGVVHVEMHSGAVNALGSALRHELREMLRHVETDLGTRVLILTGRGPAFCAGDDLREALERGLGICQSLHDFVSLMKAVECCRVPVIAAINGHCIGGGLELALCCDIRIADETATFCCAGVNVGLAMSTYRLPRAIGMARAKTLLLTGRRLSAVEAMECDLVGAVCSKAALPGAALSIATEIASRAPLAVEATKKLTNAAFDRDSDSGDLSILEALVELARTEDYRAALEGFAQGRAPVFSRV